jgi:lysophospholipase L1-like esterase
MRRLFILTWLTAAVLAYPCQGAEGAKAPAAPAAAAPAAKIKVACVGDSITFGHGVAPAETYPAVLGTLLGSGYEVANFGRPGATVIKKGDLPYTKMEEYGRSDAFAPDIAVLMLGTNDAKGQNWVHQADFDADYKDLLAYYRGLPSHPKVYVCLVVFALQNSFGISAAAVQNEVVPRLKKIAEETRAPLIDANTPFASHREWLADGVHPNAAGYAALAQIVADGLASIKPPTITPEGGTFASPVKAKLATETPGATVRYTTDGSDPTLTRGIVYRGPLTVDKTTTVKAIAVVKGKPPSEVASAIFTISKSPEAGPRPPAAPGEPAVPQDKPASGRTSTRHAEPRTPSLP